MTASARLRPLARVAGVLGALTLALAAFAGDLDPPGGVITPTLKTLDEVEPRTPMNLTNTPGDADSVYKITTPGSYYLIGNLKGISGKYGIEITASNVTIDLMGFHISGVPGTLDGIRTTAFDLESIAIRNGTVQGWAGNGIYLPLSKNCRIEGVRASNNATAGIRTGQNTVVSGCVSFNNTFAIISGLACTITECTAYQNSGWAIEGAVGTIISRCTSYENGTQGIVINAGTVRDCTLRSNGLHGILAYASTVTNCNIASSAQAGIWASNNCILLANNCTDNGTDGIHIDANGNRVEGNNCTENATGIDVDGAANYIIRNTCTDNTTNFQIAINNRYGAIMNHTMTGTPSVNGNSASSVMGTTDPWANFANESPP